MNNNSSIVKKVKYCKNGHQFFKSSSCIICPICQKLNKNDNNVFNMLSAPARRALEKENITNVKKLSFYSKKQILALHGIGPASIPTLEKALDGNGLKFKEE